MSDIDRYWTFSVTVVVCWVDPAAPVIVTV